jgi:predicted dehydrogenase
MRLRVGLVGIGKHGLRYAKHIREDVDELRLVAVSRRDAPRGRAAAETLGCDYVPSAAALAEREDIDLVIFAAAPAVITEAAKIAVTTGKRLLVEKPVAFDLSSGLGLLDLIERHGAYCMAGHTLRLNSVVRELERLVGDLGRIDSLMFSQRFPPQLDLPWLDDPALSGGGNVLHTGTHCFDLCRLFTGAEPTTAFCVGHSVHTKRTEDVFQCSLTLSNGALASVSCSRTTQSRNGLIEISGERGQLVADHVLHTLYTIGPSGMERYEAPPPRHTVLELLRALVDDCRRDRPPTIDYRTGLSAVAVADACYRSMGSHTSEAVVMPPIRP